MFPLCGYAFLATPKQGGDMTCERASQMTGSPLCL